MGQGRYLIVIFRQIFIHTIPLYTYFPFTAGEYRLNQLNVYHVMCTLQDVESGGIGQEAVSPGIMGLLENSAIGKHDLKSNNLIKPKELTNSRISLDALKKDLCSNKTP